MLRPAARWGMLLTQRTRQLSAAAGPTAPFASPASNAAQTNYSRWDVLAGSRKSGLETEDENIIARFVEQTTSLRSTIIANDHPLHAIADSVRVVIDEKWEAAPTDKRNEKIFNLARLTSMIQMVLVADSDNRRKRIVEFLVYQPPLTTPSTKKAATLPSESSPSSTPVLLVLHATHEPSCVIEMRTRLLHNYLVALGKSVTDGDTNIDAVSREWLMRLSDSFLLGTSSERLLEHYHLCGGNITQMKLQDSFYGIFEPEIQTVLSLFKLLISPNMKVRGLQKIHKKALTKLGDSFLLDILELNTKSRMVFCWADVKYTGFQALPDEKIMPLAHLLVSRYKYFSESLEVGHLFARGYSRDLALLRATKRENDETFRYLVAFWAAVIGAEILLIYA